MKMKRERIGQRTVYTGWLAPYWIEIRNADGPTHWHVIFYQTPGKRSRITHGPVHSLRGAKEVGVAWWLVTRVAALFQSARSRQGMTDLNTLGYICLDVVLDEDRLAPMVLRDWMEENGFGDKFYSWIAEPGRKARVAWPRGWEFLGQPERKKGG